MHDDLLKSLLNRVRIMASDLRMDSLGNVHVTPVERTIGKYWRIQAESSNGRIIGFYLFDDGTIQIFGTIPADVSAGLGTLGKTDQPGVDVLGHGGWFREWTDTLSQLDMFAEGQS